MEGVALGWGAWLWDGGRGSGMEGVALGWRAWLWDGGRRMGLNFHHPGAEHIMPLNSRSCLFPFEDGFLDDGHGDPSSTPGLNSPTRCHNGERLERYSRKVFVGGLPPDIDEGEETFVIGWA
ncbi:Cytoplasmic polyadenylation element-binding protein 3 [Liparis tanakae]|uniref:Cytoplasmic polyadenylation element-binding protein 3 n=1 Tax=Liparis tanakae TaxID=230148 RepID=A0A4Z2EHV5_9TELE|nr:Cytoplasmic polyadenylation element-binding protein 3 [Liparis tanakae]